MRKPGTILLVISALFVCGSITATASRAQNPPIGLYGSWSSSQHPGVAGRIQLADLKISGDGVMVGRVFFTGSACADWANFTGRVSGNLAVFSMIEGSCGLTQVTLQWQGNAWVGTYTSQYPDAGFVQMLP
jgi:hypothetical protein